MRNGALLLLSGIAAGAAATYWAVSDPHVPATQTAFPQGGSSATGYPETAAASDMPSVAERLSLYERVARANVTDLEGLAREAAASSSGARRFMLGAVLGRLAEIDPLRAVRLARELDIERELLSPPFLALATVDQSAALAELSLVESRPLARAVGLAMLEVTGYDAPAIDRVLTALPGADADAFRISAIETMAATDPEGALQLALALGESGLQRHALEHVASDWGRRDSRAARSASVRIDDPALRGAWEGAVLHGWIHEDPESALTWFADLDAPAQQRVMRHGGLYGVTYTDPMRALALADRIAPPARDVVRQLAMTRLAERDAPAALAVVEGLTLGMRRQEAYLSIAPHYGRQDPHGAGEWARSLPMSQSHVLASVLAGVARDDIGLALELAANEVPSSRQGAALSQIVADYTYQSRGQIGDLAERLLGWPEAGVREEALHALATHWLTQDASAAMAWLVANGDRVPAEAFGAAAMQLAQQDPDAAALYANQVPSGMRKDWILHAVQGVSYGDPQRVVQWIGQFRGEPGYEEVVVAAAQTSAWQDPASAVRLLETVDPASPAYRNAVDGVVQAWAQQDRTAARAWTLGLPRGDARDIALQAFFQDYGNDAPAPDRPLLAAFSNDGARQEAARSAVYWLAGRNPSEARAFADEWITHPDDRLEAERAIEMIAQQSGLQ